jgi:hypothetical protein
MFTSNRYYLCSRTRPNLKPALSGAGEALGGLRLGQGARRRCVPFLLPAAQCRPSFIARSMQLPRDSRAGGVLCSEAGAARRGAQGTPLRFLLPHWLPERRQGRAWPRVVKPFSCPLCIKFSYQLFYIICMKTVDMMIRSTSNETMRYTSNDITPKPWI